MAEQDTKQTESEQPTEQPIEQAEPSAEAVPQEQRAEPAEHTEEAAGEGGEGGEDVAPEDLVAQLQEQVAAARDQALRAQAEAQNIKRRAEQDLEKARKFALEQDTNDLRPVVDNLERALEAASSGEEASKSIAEGVELTLKSFLDAMGRFNIEKVDPEGEPFDPNMHQAMSMIENDQVEPNSVIAVVQKGYTLNGRLVRPAMVMVSKAGN